MTLTFNQLKKLGQEAEEFTKDLNEAKKDRFKVTSRKNIYPGAMIQFKYNAKHKDTLKFWDGNPAVIVLRFNGRRMLALNLHFVPFKLRKLIAEYVIKRNRSNIKNNRPIYIDYKMMKNFLISIKATVCIRAYIVTRMSSKVTMVISHKDYIIGATSLKTAKLYKMTSDEIYRLAMGKITKKKKTGSRRYSRAKKKKSLKIK